VFNGCVVVAFPIGFPWVSIIISSSFFFSGAAETAAELASFWLNRPAFCFYESLASSGRASNIVLLLHIFTQSFSILSLASSGVRVRLSLRSAQYTFGMCSLAVNLEKASIFALASLSNLSYSVTGGYLQF